uniref:Uncharacterized protein n=1 Tax=Mycena chlorophos TaxID=658473 RepID=A0ABQ0L8H7_MYCCL|nr:predicted protein [Mycena chlorophos]
MTSLQDVAASSRGEGRANQGQHGRRWFDGVLPEDHTGAGTQEDHAVLQHPLMFSAAQVRRVRTGCEDLEADADVYPMLTRRHDTRSPLRSQRRTTSSVDLKRFEFAQVELRIHHAVLQERSWPLPMHD